jgi:plasmid stabilization system protein ParE
MRQLASGKVLQARFADDALVDIDAALAYSLAQFGVAGATRYAALIELAVKDLCEQPERLGVRTYTVGRSTFFAYHLKFSRRNMQPAQRVAQPRHLIFFKVQRRKVMIARVLHDAMDFLQHLEASS